MLEQNETMLKQFWLFRVKSWPHLNLPECAVILAIDHRTNWHGMVTHKSISLEGHDVHDCLSTLTVPCNLLPR